MDIFAAVDGTGPDDDSDYATEFRNSHLNRMQREWHSTAKWYRRGPTLTGSETQGLAVAQARFAAQQYAANPGSRIFLGGYSRGGAAAEVASHILKRMDIPVHCLILFDAVDRSSVETPGVPDNVDYCFHAMRSAAAGSREIFGNCSTTKLGGRKMEKKNFFCTHGAMGGVPQTETGFMIDTVVEVPLWQASAAQAMGSAFGGAAGGLVTSGAANQARHTNVTPEQNIAGSAAVWSWMYANLMAARNA